MGQEPKKQFSFPDWDRIGMWLSYGCAVHCAVVPLLTGLSGIGLLSWIMDEPTEMLIVLASLAIGITRLSYSYLRDHRRPEPVLFFIVGAALVLIAKNFLAGGAESYEPIAMVAGGSLIGTAHLRNHSQCKDCHPSLSASADR
ncbi:MAG: hypothetical protein OHK0021_10720 [Bryobacter sp.]